jgi:hypothetical protein
MFSRQELAEDTIEALGSVADAIAQGIERKRVEEARALLLNEERAARAEAEEAQRRLAFLAEALLGEEGAEEVLRFRLPGTDEERWSVVKATPIFDEGGNVRWLSTSSVTLQNRGGPRRSVHGSRL